jgi:hypothetical protein
LRGPEIREFVAGLEMIEAIATADLDVIEVAKWWCDRPWLTPLRLGQRLIAGGVARETWR